ncbi:hypothetical protein KEM54_003931 [Ascosphaera aggregata]|nr:hypothetical protein KEM54_003931 [Ascosphaera aggregata]
MGLKYNEYLSCEKIYGCSDCHTHLADHEAIISRSFHGQHGKALLFDDVVNVIHLHPVERTMTTGRHIVRDIQCANCRAIIGWTYDKAFEPSEKYKEGKYILEETLIVQINS